MFNVIKSTSSVSLPPRPLPSFLEAYTYLAACLLQYKHVRARQGDGGGWGIWVVLLLVVVRRGGGGGGGGKAWVNKGRWEKKKETSEAIISGRAVAVSLGVWMCVCVCFLSFFFVISYSLDVADAQLGPITVYRLLMSSHFDKLLNLEWPSRCSNTHSPLSLPLAASTRLPPSLIPEPKVARSRWCLGLLRGFDHQKCTICIIASFNEERRLWNKNKPVKKGAIWAPYLLNLSENVLKS